MTFPWTHILIAATAYWFLGALWFSVLAGKTWMAEVTKHGIRIQKPTPSQFAVKLISTFLLQFVTCAAMAIVIDWAGLCGPLHGLKLGLLFGVGISMTTIGVMHAWEGRTLKMFLIDASYPVLACIAAGEILCILK